MTLGTPRPRNWGREDQRVALARVCSQHKVAFQVRASYLFLARSSAGMTLPFNESIARLEHLGRNRWQARHVFDDHVLATGISLTDVIHSTIRAVVL